MQHATIVTHFYSLTCNYHYNIQSTR